MRFFDGIPGTKGISPGVILAIPTKSGFPRSCSSKHRSRRSFLTTNDGLKFFLLFLRWHTLLCQKPWNFGPDWVITGGSGCSTRRQDTFKKTLRKNPRDRRRVEEAAGYRSLYGRSDRQHRMGRKNTGSGRECDSHSHKNLRHRSKHRSPRDPGETLVYCGFAPPG